MFLSNLPSLVKPNNHPQYYHRSRVPGSGVGLPILLTFGGERKCVSRNPVYIRRPERVATVR